MRWDLGDAPWLVSCVRSSCGGLRVLTVHVRCTPTLYQSHARLTSHVTAHVPQLSLTVALTSAVTVISLYFMWGARGGGSQTRRTKHYLLVGVGFIRCLQIYTVP